MGPLDSKLQLEEYGLERVLCSRTMGSGRGSTYQVFYTVTQAEDARDAMIKRL